MRRNLGLLLVAVAAAMAVGGIAAAQYPSRARLTAAPSGWTTDGTTTSTTQTATLTPGPLQVGARGISSDGGIIVPSSLAYPIALSGLAGGLQGVCLFGGTPTSCTVGLNYNNSSNTVAIGINSGTTIATQGPITSTHGITSNIASGSVALQTLTGAKTCLGSAGVGCLTYQTASTSLEQSLGVGTAGSGTGITVVSSGALRPFVHKVTVAFGAMTAAATTDITLWTLPAKARLSRVVADYTVVFAGGAITDVDVTCGKTAGANEYLVTHDVDTAIGTYGVAAAEIGASLLSATAADVNWATQAVICRFTCAGANCNAATTGSATYYLEGVSYP